MTWGSFRRSCRVAKATLKPSTKSSLMTCKHLCVDCNSTKTEWMLPFLGHVCVLVCLCRTHCNAELMSQKELCEERVEAAKAEATKKMKITSTVESTQVRRLLFIRMLHYAIFFFFFCKCFMYSDFKVFYFAKWSLSSLPIKASKAYKSGQKTPENIFSRDKIKVTVVKE